MIKLTLEDFINKAKETHKDKFDYSLTIYINTRTKLKIKCNKCLITFEQLARCHLKSGCLKCSNIDRTSNTTEFVKKAKKIHDNKYNYQLVEYIKCDIKVKIICNKCLTIFNQSPSHHLNNTGCPICKFSKGEARCFEILKLNINIKEIIPQFKFDNCKNIFPLPFDFKVNLHDDKYFLIEYQGRQHYDKDSWFNENLEDIQKRDKIKYDYCKNNNIDLLVIKYTEFKNIKNIIEQNFIK